MIRPINAGDLAELGRLIVATGLFQSEELAQLDTLMKSHLSSEGNVTEHWVVYDADGLVGVAYFAAERMTQGTWNLYLIGVHPDRQGRGHGAALLRHVEEMLRAQGGRVLIVETSGLEGFQATRAFYGRCGYTEEARIRDFYSAGDDKVVFWKAL